MNDSNTRSPDGAAELIRELHAATHSNRLLDARLALYAGFTRTAIGTGPAVWRSPSGEVVTKIPHFTHYIETAKSFAEMIAPKHAAAVSWGEKPSAVVNEGPRCFGATPAIALCIAAMKSLH